MSVISHHSTPRSSTSVRGRTASLPTVRPVADVRVVQLLSLFVAAALVAVAVVMGA